MHYLVKMKDDLILYSLFNFTNQTWLTSTNNTNWYSTIDEVLSVFTTLGCEDLETFDVEDNPTLPSMQEFRTPEEYLSAIDAHPDCIKNVSIILSFKDLEDLNKRYPEYLI